jgi:hypothetical protein
MHGNKGLDDSLHFLGADFLRCNKILSQQHHFLFLLPSHFLPCKDTFMDDYDGI